MLRPGDVLDNRYRLDTPLASGGMGDVWRATDLVLGRTVAVKVLLAALLTDPSFSARFRAEARMMAALHHPGVVAVYDYGESKVDSGGTVAYLVMAFVQGEPLSHRIATEGRLPVGDTLSIVAQAADALHAVHGSGIVHRDVKPANMLIQDDGTVVLVDFGVAHSSGATRLTGTNMVLGTALYMAPEQASGRPVSAATDIYALGVVAYHSVAGYPPFDGDSALNIAIRHMKDEVPPLPGDVPAPVVALIGRALAKDPAHRYPSAAAFAAAARDALQGRSTAVMPGEPGAATMPYAGAMAAGAAAVPPPRSTLAGPAAEPWAPTRAGAPNPPTPTRPSTPARRRWPLLAVGLAAVLLGLGALALAQSLGDRGGSGQTPNPSPTHSTFIAPPLNPTTVRQSPAPTTRPTTTKPATPSGPQSSGPGASGTGSAPGSLPASAS